MMLSLFFGTFFNIRKIKSTDLVICIVPFTISVLPALILTKLRKAKLWIHIQDFEFDLALESGIIKNNSLFLKLFKKSLSFFENKMLNSATVVSSISNNMLIRIKEKSSHNNPYYFPNWVSSLNINPETSSNHEIVNLNKFTLLYSGNIGEKQDWNLLFDLCEKIRISDNINIVIVGEGAFRSQLEILLAKFSFVHFHNPVPYSQLNDLLCSVNVHFLFQKQEVLDTIMPSKILGMMASARPSIITGNSKSEVAKVLSDSEGGYYFHTNEVESIYESLLKLKNDNNRCEKIGWNARKYIINKFSDEKILTDFVDKVKITLLS